MLESADAVRRKGTLAVYRALRVQITRFEEAFMQMHGRRPKGAIEKAPLATTYAQYREWKRFIRMDAARRIQALFRGARTRWNLERNSLKQSQVSKLVSARATKDQTASNTAVLTENLDHSQKITLMSSSSLDEIRSPSEILDIEENKRTRSEYKPFPNHERDDPSTDSSQDDESDFQISSSLIDDDSPMPTLPPLSLPELRARKREVKDLLREYDIKFLIENGRMPKKSEKEPIRYLYDRYNALKDLISRKRLLQ